MNRMRSIQIGLLLMLLCGCDNKPPPPYGHEQPLTLKGPVRPLWAVAPALNLSGQPQVDPLLQADLLYEQLQAVSNITVIPVDRVVQVYAALRIEKVQTEQQASLVCEQLGCDALVIPTVTAYDPYDPPKFGVALQLLGRGTVERPKNLDLRELVRRASPPPESQEPLAAHPQFIQAVGMFDAANGSVHEAVLAYAQGRNDPQSALGAKEFFVNMDSYCGFAYHALIVDLIHQVEARDDSRVALAP